MLQSSSPSLISLSVSQSALVPFLMPLLLSVSLLPLSFSKFLQFHTSAHYNLCTFLLSFQCQCQMHFLLFLSITVISGRLGSRVLSVCIGKSHKIFQFSDSKTFSGLSSYHFSHLLKPYFWHSFQWSILARLSCLNCLYSFCASFEHYETIFATVSSGAHIQDR